MCVHAVRFNGVVTFPFVSPAYALAGAYARFVLLLHTIFYSLTKRSFEGFLLGVKGGAMDPHSPAVPPGPPRRFPQIPPDSQSSPIFQIFNFSKFSMSFKSDFPFPFFFDFFDFTFLFSFYFRLIVLLLILNYNYHFVC